MALDRRDLILALIDAGNGTVAGVTRLQKYLFLLLKEYGLGDAALFEPYRFGPYAPKLYDDIQYLENIGFLEGEKPPAPAEDVEAMDFGFLAPKQGTPAASPSDEELVEREGHYEEYEESQDDLVHATQGDLGPERRFRLTKEAKAHLDAKLQGADGQQVKEACADVKRRFRNLGQLIRHVYTKYPDFVTESEIREKILGE